jgi:hypothetical protein
MIRLASPIPALAGMQLGEEDQGADGFQLLPKVKGPRRLLMDILREDPEMAEMLKKMRMTGDNQGGFGDE